MYAPSTIAKSWVWRTVKSKPAKRQPFSLVYISFPDGLTSDNDVRKSTQTRCRQGRADLNETIAPGLRIKKRFLELLDSELPILQTSLITPDSLNHEHLVLFREAFSFHRRVG